MHPPTPPDPLPTLQAAWAAVKTGLSAAHYATLQGDQLTDFLEHTTGPEREELEAKAKGVENPWHEAWWVLPPPLPLLPAGCACWRRGREGWREGWVPAAWWAPARGTVGGCWADVHHGRAAVCAWAGLWLASCCTNIIQGGRHLGADFPASLPFVPALSPPPCLAQAGRPLWH